MLNVFLQSWFSDIGSALGLGTLVFAIATILTLIYTIRQTRESRYLDFIKDIDKRLAEQIEKENDLEDHEQRLIYAYNYIDICEQVMFLIKKRKLHEDFFNYYIDFFNYAITLLWWYTTVYPEDKHSLKSSWSTMTDWIIFEKPEPYPLMHLPAAMKDELSDVQKATDVVILHNDLVKRIEAIRH